MTKEKKRGEEKRRRWKDKTEKKRGEEMRG